MLQDLDPSSDGSGTTGAWGTRSPAGIGMGTCHPACPPASLRRVRGRTLQPAHSLPNARAASAALYAGGRRRWQRVAATICLWASCCPHSGGTARSGREDRHGLLRTDEERVRESKQTEGLSKGPGRYLYKRWIQALRSGRYCSSRDQDTEQDAGTLGALLCPARDKKGQGQKMQ